MTVKLTIVIDNPKDANVFEARYAEPDFKALITKIPNLIRAELAKVFPKEDGSPTPAYRTIELYFANYDTANASLSSPAAGELAGGLVEISTGGVKFLLADIED